MAHGADSWKENERSAANDDGNGGIPTIVWVVGPAVLLVLLLIVWQCWKRRRITKRAKQAHQDEVLNLPLATPWEASAVPYARVVDIAATAPDHDELLPATAPVIDIQTRRAR